jgi:N-acetylglucosamine-6-phosphate deacetylase
MASATPARIMGIDNKKGSLAKGKDADILIFDRDITIQTTIINGNIVFQRT